MIQAIEKKLMGFVLYIQNRVLSHAKILSNFKEVEQVLLNKKCL